MAYKYFEVLEDKFGDPRYIITSAEYVVLYEHKFNEWHTTNQDHQVDEDSGPYVRSIPKHELADKVGLPQELMISPYLLPELNKKIDKAKEQGDLLLYKQLLREKKDILREDGLFQSWKGHNNDRQRSVDKASPTSGETEQTT